ncbi:MFS transporter [Microbacterium sp. X-17]|uniref:MFS transporter n=1 Tax=Microbacterium sp. X-17 TaxID=3144404 RepID=UPI0031F58B48
MSAPDAPGRFNGRLAILLAMAMFVLVVDTSIMNVSISAVVRDLHTTASAVQSTIALEALVSAAFILIGGKAGDLIGRKLAYILGLLGYAVGAVAMTLVSNIAGVIVFWAIIGGLGASLLLPSMQSLVHGNFAGVHRTRTYALIGASAAIAAAVGPLLGGVITTFLSWRVAFLLEALVIGVVLLGIPLVKDVKYTGPRTVDPIGAALSIIGMGGVVLGILLWQEGAGFVGLTIAVGVLALVGLGFWLVARHRRHRATLLDPELFRSAGFRTGATGQLLQQVTLGGTMIVIPLYLQIILEYNAFLAGLCIAPLSLTMFAVALLAGRRTRGRPANKILLGFALAGAGLVVLVPIVPLATNGWYLIVPLILSGSGLGLLVSQLNNYTLSPIPEERVSEAAGVNSAAGSFGLSFGLAVAGAVLLATLAASFTSLANASTVLNAEQKTQVAAVLEEDAELMSNTALAQAVAHQPPDVAAEMLRINSEAGPFALQIALLVPILSAGLGLVNALRMRRLPDPPAAGADVAAGAG